MLRTVVVVQCNIGQQRNTTIIRNRYHLLNSIITTSLSCRDYKKRNSAIRIDHRQYNTNVNTLLTTASSNTEFNINEIKRLWYVDPITGNISRRRSGSGGNKKNSRTNSNNYNDDVNDNVIITEYQVKVGLEIHVQLNHCKTKLFSNGHIMRSSSLSSPSSSVLPNSIPYIHPYDLAVPGTLPIISLEAVRTTILLAGVLHCRTINDHSRFERKHYTYPDLPHSYQLTQQRYPIAQHGYIECVLIEPSDDSNNPNHHKNSSKSSKSTPMQQHPSPRQQKRKPMIRCRVKQLQLEQDTGKSTTYSKKIDQTTTTTTTITRIDYNRAGIPLCEIVTEPDLQSSYEAISIVKHLQQLIHHTNISSAHMQHGQFRVDCNINILPIRTTNVSCTDDDDDMTTNVIDGSQQHQELEKVLRMYPHPRVEVKNLNSVQQIEDSIQYEAYRQLYALEQIQQQQQQEKEVSFIQLLKEETRTYDPKAKRTVLLRYKDQQQDYRFMFEPDLPPLNINNKLVLKNCNSIQEYIDQYTPILPSIIQQQLIDPKTFGLSNDQAHMIVYNHQSVLQYFKEALYYTILMQSQSLHESSSNIPLQNATIQSSLSIPDLIERHARLLAESSSNTATISTTTTIDKTQQQQHPPSLKDTAALVVNLLCNVLFHLVKEQYRKNLTMSAKTAMRTEVDENHIVQNDHDDNQDDDEYIEMNMEELSIRSQQLGEIVLMIQEQMISYTMAKQIIQILFAESTTSTKLYRSPRQIAKERNIELITNLEQLRAICIDELSKHPEEVQVYLRGGKFEQKMIKLFIGKVMTITNGNAHPERLRDVVIDCLSKTKTK